MFDNEFAKENHDFRDFLLGMFRLPFINENDEEIKNKYLGEEFYFEDTDNGIVKQKCLGLAAAYLYETLSISFQNGGAWVKNELNITIETSDGNSKTEIVKNVYSKDCFSKAVITDYVEQLGDIQLQETRIIPADKENHFAPHHGKHELQLFWNKLKNNPYIISAISTGWGGDSFIRKISRNGTIEIVLIHTVHRYALLVQTTGRNYRETETIAGLLQKEYF
jgi:hypothetical protein